LAKAPGKDEGDADYAVKVVTAKAHNPEVMKTDPNFAKAPEKGAEADTDLEVNSEMGYNLDKAKEFNLEDAIAYVKNNKDSKEVREFLKATKMSLTGESGASEANEDIETSLDESEESKKN
jgi:hypothetical protein